MPFVKIGPFYLGEPNAKEIERVEGNARRQARRKDVVNAVQAAARRATPPFSVPLPVLAACPSTSRTWESRGRRHRCPAP